MSADDTVADESDPGDEDPLRAPCPKCRSRGPHRWATHTFEEFEVICARCGHRWEPGADAGADGG